MLKLYDYFRSSASFRVRIALNVKGLTYESVPVHLVNHGGEQHQPEYGKINPQELVPTLLVNNHVLTQSLAIIEYLDEQYPNPPLLRENPAIRAQIRGFAQAIASDVHPLNNLRVLNYLTQTLGVSEEQKQEWYQHWVETGLNALEKQLVQNKHHGKFCFGDHLTLADLCLVPQMYNARRFNCRLDNCPTLVAIDQTCQQVAAVKAAWPEEQITA